LFKALKIINNKKTYKKHKKNKLNNKMFIKVYLINYLITLDYNTNNRLFNLNENDNFAVLSN